MPFPQLSIHHDVAFEVQHVQFHLSQYRPTEGLMRRFPFGIDHLKGTQTCTPAQVQQITHAVQREFHDLQQALGADILRHVAQYRPGLDQFFDRFDPSLVPPDVEVHLTLYGPGGSYFPPYSCETYIPGSTQRVTVQLPGYRPFVHFLVHEIIHLTIYSHFRPQTVGYEETEWLTDRICSCNELMQVYGPYRIQNMRPPLPGQFPPYNHLWRPGQHPTI